VNWSEFFAMGGYADFVWSSYALAAAVLVFNVVLPLLRRRSVLAALREFHRLKDKTE
jgi:heme exporter protein D